MSVTYTKLGQYAAEYDEFRPSYPDALFGDLLVLKPHSVLDIACGTGSAMVPFRNAGIDVRGMDIDPAMASQGRQKGLRISVGTFESWVTDLSFDLQICAQAWHWIRHPDGLEQVKRLMRPHGTFVAFWTFPKLPTSVLRTVLPIYESVAPSLVSRSVLIGNGSDSINAMSSRLRGLGQVREARYLHVRPYTADQWTGLMRTFGDHRNLPPGKLDILCERVSQGLDAQTMDVTLDTVALFVEIQ